MRFNLPTNYQMIKQILIKQLLKGIFINKNVFLCETMPFCQKKEKLKGK